MASRREHNAQKLKIARCAGCAHKRAMAAARLYLCVIELSSSTKQHRRRRPNTNCQRRIRMNPNTSVRGGLIRLVAGPVAAFAIVGAAVGLSAAAHASTAPDTHTTHAASATVEHGPGGPGTHGHGTGEAR
jgi:hypothetical protein